jgi:hypothetical protein
MVGFTLLSALLTAATTVQSPTSTAAVQDNDRDIIVKGERIKHEQITGFIKALSNVPSAGQIGRFHSAVCPAAVGLPKRQGDAVAERMRRVAAAADIRIARGTCTPNVFLIAVPDKRAAIRQLSSQFPAYFGEMTARQIKQLANDPRPAVAWQVENRLSADGEELEKPIGTDFYIVKGTGSGSRIRAGSVPNFIASIVMVDLNSIGGLTVTQVADYAAMRAFAETDPARASHAGAPTILTILDAADSQPIPLTLTAWDLGYLKSLYTTSNAYYASYHRGEMAHVLKQELAKVGQSGD